MSKSKEKADRNARKLRHSFADRPQPTTTPLLAQEPLSASSAPVGEPVIDLREQRIKQEQKRRGILANLRTQFPEDPEFNKTWGRLLFGTDMKTVDGRQEPWTSEDFYEYSKREAGDTEMGSRRTLTRDLTFAFDMQSRHFGNPEDPENGETTEVIDACATILGRVLNSREQVTEMWPTDPLEARNQAQMLEVIRRITLKPSYFMFGMGHDGDLEAVSFPGDEFGERRRASKKYEEFLKITGLERNEDGAKAFIKNNVVGYAEEDWIRILAMQEHVVFRYVKEFTQRSATGAGGVSRVAPRLVEYGDPVYTTEELEKFRMKAGRIDQIAAVVKEMQSFSELFPQIKKWFGEEVGFKDFIDRLSPARINRRGAFEVSDFDFLD